MIKSASEIRAAARESLSGKWGGAVLMCLVYLVITMVCSAIPVVGSLLTLFLIPLGWSYSVAFLENARDKSELKIEKLFVGFNDYTRLFCTLLLQGVYTMLWTLLLFVPGIIKSYSYARRLTF